MKKLTFLSLVCGLLMVGCNQPAQDNTVVIPGSEKKANKEVLAENKAEVKMKVEGMVCAMGCAKFIEDKVAGLDGVILSQVDFKEGEAMFEYDKTELSAEEIETYINNIHDGQYNAKIKNESTGEEVSEGSSAVEDKPSIVSVTREVTNISFPQVFTYFLKRLR